MENAQPHNNAKPSALGSLKSNKMMPKFTPRQKRVLAALWKTGGWIWRETVDRIARASNGPEVIRQLRHTYLIEIDMRRVQVSDADGLPSTPGQYMLTDKGRDALISYGWAPEA